MPPIELSRRTFLTAAGGAALLAACGGSSSSKTAKPNRASAGTGNLSAFRMEIEPYVSTDPQRLAFVLINRRRDFAGGPTASIAIAPPRGAFGPAMPATFSNEGLTPPGRGVYVVQAKLDAPGNWRGRVTIAGHPDALLAFPVTDRPEAPIVGAQARAVPSPTTANPMGVDPLCTRTNDQGGPDPCPLHAASLHRVLGAGKPVAVMFATPARCTSRYCGPVLEQLLAVQARYQNRVTLLHVEIYRDSTSNDLVPATETWLGGTGEPWLFGVDGAGQVTGRLSGAFATSEVTALLDRLTTPS